MDTLRTTGVRYLAIAVLLCTVPACALRSRSSLADGASAPPMSQLWTEAETTRDLFWGPGGNSGAPDPQADFRFVAKDTTGKSPGYDVMDPQGRTWSVKLGPEAQSEVVVSRLLWAAGYTEADTQRFVVRLRQKVDEGLAVAG